MINPQHVKDENHLRSIAKALRKEALRNYSNADFIKKILMKWHENEPRPLCLVVTVGDELLNTQIR